MQRPYISLRLSLGALAVMLVLAVGTLQISCTPQAPCVSCTPGERKCDAKNNAVLICAQGLDSGCYTWGSLPCAQGSCQVVAGSAQCGGVDKGCGGASCQVGSKRCDGGGVQTCQLDATGKCGVWSATVPCDANSSCTGDGVCQPPNTGCKINCTQGQTQCVGNAYVTCIPGDGSCMKWGPETPCQAGFVCQAGACEDNCKNVCALGQKRCSGDQIQICVTDAGSGCPLWGKPTTCADGKVCKEGDCKDAPTSCDTCKVGQKKCQGAGVQTCAKDAKGCAVFGAATPCPSGQVCEAGACKASCNTCTVGQKRCKGNGVETCAKDAKGCTAFGGAQACGPGETCDAGACKSCDECQPRATRCVNNGVSTCFKDATGCMKWGKEKACASGESCKAGVCDPGCKDPCTAGQKRCSGNAIQTCAKDAKGCLAWGAGAACPSGDTCDAGKCIKPGDLAARPQKAVCDRWKRDYAYKHQPNFTSSGSCNPGKISQGSIDDAIRRISLYRYLVGLPASVEDKALSTQTQACAVIMAHNDPSTTPNPHKPPTSWKCYNQVGATAAGRSNLSWGTAHPADTITQYMSDQNTPSLGHRLWIISPGMGKTGIGLANGPVRYRYASCMYTFAKTSAPKVDFIAYPPPGWVPIQAMGSSRHRILDWSFTSSKYRVSTLSKVTLTRQSDGDVQNLTPRKIGSYGHPAGLSFRPRFPKAGETYTVKFGTLYSYTVKFFDCK